MTAIAFAPADRMLLTAREAAAALAISERTLWSLTKCGDIAHVHAAAGCWASPVIQYDRWLDTGELPCRTHCCRNINSKSIIDTIINVK